MWKNEIHSDEEAPKLRVTFFCTPRRHGSIRAWQVQVCANFSSQHNCDPIIYHAEVQLLHVSSCLSVYSIHKAAAAATARQHEVVRRPELLEEKDPRGRQAFLDVVMRLVCDTQRDYRLQISIKELSEHLLGHVDALAAANIYRKVRPGIQYSAQSISRLLRAGKRQLHHDIQLDLF